MLGRRRFLLVVALLMGMTALLASVSSEPRRAGTGASATPTPAPGAPTEPAATLTQAIDAADTPNRVLVDEGTLLTLEVTADALDSVAIPDLAALDAVAPGVPARFDLLADSPGRYPIELVDAGTRIGTLVIRATE